MPDDLDHRRLPDANGHALLLLLIISWPMAPPPMQGNICKLLACQSRVRIAGPRLHQCKGRLVLSSLPSHSLLGRAKWIPSPPRCAKWMDRCACSCLYLQAASIPLPSTCPWLRAIQDYFSEFQIKLRLLSIARFASVPPHGFFGNMPAHSELINMANMNFEMVLICVHLPACSLRSSYQFLQLAFCLAPFEISLNSKLNYKVSLYRSTESTVVVEICFSIPRGFTGNMPARSELWTLLQKTIGCIKG